MAEFIFKDMVRKAGLEEVRIDSAAVSYEEEGNDIYPPAKRTLHGHGIPFGRHSAHRVTDAEASEYDVIIVMDASNRRLLSRIISPMNMSKVHLMMKSGVWRRACARCRHARRRNSRWAVRSARWHCPS